MSDAQFAPIDESITIDQLTLDPYPIYQRLRAEQPVLRDLAVVALRGVRAARAAS